MAERNAGSGSLVGVVISTDPEFRSRLGEILTANGGLDVALTVDEPFTAITDAHLDEVRRVDPDVIFVDLESDPHVGLKFVQFLVDSSLSRAVVGAGSTDSSDLLLQAMEAGIQDFLPKPLDEGKVTGTVERLRRKTGKTITNEGPRELGEVLSVFSPKGGAGATIFAVNLAVAIHQISRKRTLIVDLDLELGETALLLGKEPRFSSMDLVRNYHRMDEGLMASYIERDEPGVDLLSAPAQPAEFEGVDAEVVGHVLEFLRAHYDYIVVDTPKTLNPVTLNVFQAASQLYVVTTPELQSLRNVTRSMPLLERVGGTIADGDWIRLVVNRYNSSLPISPGEIERTLGVDVYWTLKNDYHPIVESINEGRPVVLSSKSEYAESVRELAAKVTGVPRAQKRRFSFLGGLLSGSKDGRGTNRK